jgi:hypothetical protein
VPDKQDTPAVPPTTPHLHSTVGEALSCHARLVEQAAALIRSTPAEALDPEVLWSVLAGIGVLDNGTWVRFDRDDADCIADAYAAEYARLSPESDR